MSVVSRNKPLAFGEFGSTRQWKAFTFSERKTVRNPKYELPRQQLSSRIASPLKFAGL